jgi:hypothetical protein
MARKMAIRVVRPRPLEKRMPTDWAAAVTTAIRWLLTLVGALAFLLLPYLLLAAGAGSN